MISGGILTPFGAARHTASLRAAEVFADSNFPLESTLDAIVERAILCHGKPIRIVATEKTDWESLTGLWVDFGVYSEIYVRAEDPWIYRVHCILHELGHILFNHPGCNSFQHSPTTASIGQGHAMRGRTVGQGDDQKASSIEAEAEELAHMLARSILRPRHHSTEKAFG